MTDSGPPQEKDAPLTAAPTAEAITAQVSRIVASAVFAKSERLSAFLRFIVDETLAGRAERLKEYTIALEVYERDESFDPRVDSIVRVEAGRLRAKIREYDDIIGRNDLVRIGLPKGGYVPDFRTAAGQSAPGQTSGAVRVPGAKRTQAPWPVYAILVSVLAVLGAGGLYLYEVRGGPSDRDVPRGYRDVGKASYSVAVLPLRNLSNDKDQDYFSDGMTEALINRLAKNDAIRVISMTSMMGYKNTNKPIAQIARELNVNHLIEGSVLRAGGRVRITAQLIEVQTDRHLWAESFERDLADVLAVQEEVARRITDALSGKVVVAEGIKPEAKPEIVPAAHDAYLKGRFFRNKMTVEGFNKAIDYFKQAIEREPDYAPALAGMASCYCLLSGHGFEIVRPKDAMPAAKAAAMKALSLDDSLPEVHTYMGVILLKYEWDWPGAEKAFKRAIELNPSFAEARLVYSFYLEAMGRQNEAIREAEQARVIAPISLPVNVNLGWQYLGAGRLEQARRQFESTAELDPKFWGVHWGLGHYYRGRGMYDEAIAAFKRAVDARGGHALPMSALGHTFAVAGRPAQARKVLDDLKALSRETYVSPFNMATIYVGLGEKDEAFAWLDKAFEERSRSLVWLNVMKEYDGLRSDPRFESLLRRIGLSE